ncbi:hypothetical protein A2U01_0025822, partial [Trifolium medium]|nr:hypothetical protein [Trifolium medium]
MNGLFEKRDPAASESQERNDKRQKLMNETGGPSRQVGEGEDDEEVLPIHPITQLKKRIDPILKENENQLPELEKGG